MNKVLRASLPNFSARWVWLLAFLAIVAALLPFAGHWSTAGLRMLPHRPQRPPSAPSGHETGEEPHDHAHPDHDEANSLELSEQARKNIGVEIVEIKLQPFERTISVPGVVVERPGRTATEMTAPLTGVVTRIYPIQGEAVEPGQPLFELRLTHEELVQAQANFLRTAEELDVIGKEVARLEAVTKAIAGKTLLERKYEQQKQQAALRAQRQSLLLHGLSEEQVEEILASRKLLQSLMVRAPENEDEPANGRARLLQVQELRVQRGQHVEAGTTLCSLVNHSELYIEGTAFEQDVDEINQAAGQDWKVSAVRQSKGAESEIIAELSILYVAGRIDVDSRALHFYVVLPNELLRESQTPDGRRLISWKYKPGQRMQIRVPVERWEDRIVLPVEAVAQDGVESYIFQPNGDHFDRRPVHVEYRDEQFAVIANDGSLFPGDMVAVTAAQQMQLALKSKAGGGVDPHAGHNH